MRLTNVLLLILCFLHSIGQDPAGKVNVFLGTSGDHGQLSPAASSPFGMLSIGPQTYPNQHTGYEYRAKTFLGFTHNRFEGVGCTGSGGNIMITPFTGNPDSSVLTKQTERASPGEYAVSFSSGLSAKFVVQGNTGIEDYRFPAAVSKGFIIDLRHTLSNRFVAEQHVLSDHTISGWIDSKTTCNAGTYRVYYVLLFDQPVQVSDTGNARLTIAIKQSSSLCRIRVALSSVDVEHAVASLTKDEPEILGKKTRTDWNKVLGAVTVKGDASETALFYSLLYRTVQSPYLISEKDGSYRSTDGALHQSKLAGDSNQVYNGWAIWDNYRTQLPLLSILFPDRYKGMVKSIAGLYRAGKKDYATDHEPSNTVRTEHAIVVLLDAYRKEFAVDFATILDSLVAEQQRLDFSKPDKALESSYDTWALSQIFSIVGSQQQSDVYKKKAGEWKDYWKKDFSDLTRPDVDRIGARGMYQGTIWQYRWLVPFDMKGLMQQAGGEDAYISQLDHFFNHDLYNHANETDLQAPLMYNITSQPWKSQHLVRKYAADTVVQYYFNDNSRGIDPFVDRVYRNTPDTYIRTMDDDAGAMSAWYVFAATGLMPACVGWPVYYLSVPLFDQVTFNQGSRSFDIKVLHRSPRARYVQSATLNGKPLTRNWLTHEEIARGGSLIITAGETPDKKWGTTGQWIPALD